MDITYHHAHFNRRTFCHVPAYWLAELDEGTYYTENDEGQSREDFARRAVEYFARLAVAP